MTLIKIKDVMKATSLARPTIYKYIKNGTFPRPVSLGGRAVAWVREEIEDWIEQRVAERDSEIKQIKNEEGS
ncbi:MAG TPA: transcriptional regulator [Idiomarina loihiensis]|nr:transcriptional regulator [Idiomarina loihiensis]